MDNSFRILVVEDAVIAQEVAKSHLTQLNCLVDIAASSKSAIEQCDKVKYDLILMDLELYPGDNGFETAKQIRKKSALNEQTPVVVLSMHSQAFYSQQLKDTSIAGFIDKPFTPYEANEVVKFLHEKSERLNLAD